MGDRAIKSSQSVQVIGHVLYIDSADQLTKVRQSFKKRDNKAGHVAQIWYLSPEECVGSSKPYHIPMGAPHYCVNMFSIIAVNFKIILTLRF
jgi:hypothetical protein